jgi:phosphoglycolate phosphatase
MRPSTVIFDLDGTLIDSERDLRAAADWLLQEFRAAPLSREEFRVMLGDGVAALVGRALAARKCRVESEADAIRRFLDYYENHLTDTTRPYPGVPEGLATLHSQGLTLGLCTNKATRTTRAILERLGLADYFAGVIAGDSVPYRKPDPRVLSGMLATFGVAKEVAVMVGDSEVDAATAEAAGIRFVLLTYGYHRGDVGEIPCIAALDQFAGLPVVLADL